MKKRSCLKIEQKKKLLLTLLDTTRFYVEPVIKHYTRLEDPELQRIVDYSLSPKGYRERPLLTKLSCEAVGGKFKDIILGAVAVELFHFSTLVLDDILDNSPLRGGKKTVYKVYGTNYAIIAAEVLNSLAFLALNHDSLISNVGSSLVIDANNLLKKTYRDVYCGQYLDLSFESVNSTTESQYLDMVSKTTGSLIKCSIVIGAILGGGSKKEINYLDEFGSVIGKAFQIRDDIIEIIGDAQVIGKQLGGDIKQGKMRLPLIRAIYSCTKGERKFLKDFLKNKKNDEKSIGRCIEIIVESGAIEYSKQIARELSYDSIQYLKHFPDKPSKKALIAFAEIVGAAW